MNSIIKLAALAFVAAFFCVMATSCGHNSVVYSDGIGVETTLNPETWTFGILLRYGKVFSAQVKEKTEVEMVGGMTSTTGLSGTDATAKNASAITGLESKVSIKTGDQVTGYVVELEKVKAAK
jgi:hypothetical protein